MDLILKMMLLMSKRSNINMVTGWTNLASVGYEYETLTSLGPHILSAINSSGSGYASSQKLNLVLGSSHRLTLTYTSNSGELPYIAIGTTGLANGVDRPLFQLTSSPAVVQFVHNTALEDYLWVVSTGLANFSLTANCTEI